MSVHDELQKQKLAAEAKARGRQEWEIEAERAVPTSLIRDIVGDAYRGVSQSASLIPNRLREETPPAASGGSVPIQQPPGLNYVDALCDAADRRSRAIAAQQEAETAWIESQLERAKGPRIETEYNHFSRQRMGHDDE